MPPILSNSAAGLFPSRLVSAVLQAPSSTSSPTVEAEVLGLFDALRNNLLRYAVSLGLSLHDGEDILQESFLALFRHLQQGRSRSNLRGWLFCVTHNLALKRRTVTQRRSRLHDDDVALAENFSDSALNPEQELLSIERRHRLQAILNALPERDRWCLQLRAEGLRYREIATVVGISLGSVSSSLTRSLARLATIDERVIHRDR